MYYNSNLYILFSYILVIISKKIPETEIELVKTLIDKISSTYNISQEDLINKLSAPNDSIDAAAFSIDALSPTEVLVKYLREKKFNKFSDIARFLKRSQNTIQTTYNNAQKKHPKVLSFSNSNINVPLSIFSNKKFTIFESLVRYLRDSKNMTNRDIAHILKKSNKTIWTVYNRSKLKLRENE